MGCDENTCGTGELDFRAAMTHFVNMCVFFRKHLVNLCVFRRNLVNYLEKLQIIPLGNVHIFRIIRKHEIIFLIMCVFREHLVNLCVFVDI